MADRTHYEHLGVPENASGDDIRTAYRKLVLELHPDRSGNASTTDRFVAVSEAYKVLSNPERKRQYDESLRHRREMQAQRQTAQSSASRHAQTHTFRISNVATMLVEAAREFSKGRFDRAETIAKRVIEADPTRAVAYAILGDIAMQRQDPRSALKHYAYAIQFDTLNVTYQKRYEKLIASLGEMSASGKARVQAVSPAAPLAAFALTVFMLAYVSIAREAPLFENLSLLSSWTAGLVVMMFVNGVIVGATLAMTRSVDRWDSVVRSSSGRFGPAAALGLVAIVNFWASALLYLFLGLLQNSFTYSISRFVTLVAALTVCFALMSHLSPTIIATQTLLWGGNVIYVGALCGWVIADAFR